MPFPALLRTLTKTLGVSLLWLLTAANADAAPVRHTSAAALCDARPAGPLKKLLRRAKANCGPLAAKRPLSRFGFRVHPTRSFERTRRADSADDDAAIQDDSPARLEAHDGTRSGLWPIGFLVGDVDSHSRSVSFSPRSPRGPPPSV